MNRDIILEKIQSILRDLTEAENLKLEPGSTAEDVADWDSLNHVRLMVALEAELGIRFEVNEISAPKNVGQLIDLIESKL